MRWLNRDRMKMVVIGVVAALVLSGGIVKGDFTFGEATNMGPLINSAARDATVFITMDGLQMYFGSDREGGLGNYDLWTSSRPTTEDEWGEPVNLGEPFNSPAGDLGPCLSADGLEFYFARATEVTYELWVAKRASINAPWGEPVVLGPTVDSTFDGCGPSISPDGLTLYFYDGDIWMTTRPTISDAWGPSIKLESPISTEADEGWPHITADGLALLFGSDREGGYGGNDVLMVRRSSVSNAWGTPINLGPPANMTAFESCSYVSSDGLTYYFTSNRDGGQGSYDLWQAQIIPIVDFDRDRTVGFSDLMLMVESWGTDDPQCDIGPMPWGDGIVDEADLEVLMSQWGQEVIYLNDPKQASRPTPLDGAVSDVEQTGSIRWVPGRHAAQHDVYVGTDPAAVKDADTSDTTGIYRGRQEGNEYTLAEDILPNQTFYWRIDELNTDASLTKGPVWSFSVADYLIVDDFESSEAAWARWWDGWGDPNNGSEVATEIMTVHSGNQAMWLTYDNSIAPISQVLRLWETPKDWTRKGVETLIVWVHGGSDNMAEPLQIFLGDSADNVAMVSHPDPSVLLMDDWEQWSIPLADVTGINLAEITSMTFVIGDEAIEEGGIGKIYIDDIRLHPVSMEDTQGKVGGNIIWVSDQADDNQDGIPDDQEWVDILEAEGYAVDNEDDHWQTLDEDKMAALNAADLIIVSRNTGYGGGYQYANGMEPTQWDAVTTPIINTSAILAENNRWKWLNVPWFSVGNSLNSKVDILAPDHPIFAGMTSPVQITHGEGITHFANVTGVGVGNGTMLAQLATPTEAKYAAIVEWEPGVEYYDGAGRFAGGPRMLFCAGTVQRNDDDPAGMGAMNLTPNGLKIFLNAVKMYVEK